MDPWSDYLAFPIAPLLLGLQVWALRTAHRQATGVSAAVLGAIAAMLVFVLVAGRAPQDDANIGAGILLLELVLSLGLLAAAVRRERVVR